MTRIDPEFIKIAFAISSKLGFQSMAYDFIYGNNREPQFCEISYTYVDLLVYDCPGYWDSSLGWHEGHLWPEYMHLSDALGLPELKQPSME